MVPEEQCPYTDKLRDEMVTAMSSQGISNAGGGKIAGMSKQGMDKFLKGGRIDFEKGKRLETWLEETNGEAQE